MPTYENDWMVAGLNNPTWDTNDFAVFTDMDTDNTQFMSKEYYMQSPFIKEHPFFQDENGNFSKDKFSNYYERRAQDFYDFYSNDYTIKAAMTPLNYLRTPDTPVMDMQFSIQRVYNPERYGVGLEGPGVITDPIFSQRELAKQQRVFNTETGQFEDYTVNDHTLIRSIGNWFKDRFSQPLVLATWDEDGMHVDPVLGVQVEHHKGEAKLNEKGTYYYETLGNRSIVGKDVLSVFDTFTVDGEGINKYDFFDSNDIKKSIGGTIMKNVVSIIPMFIPVLNNYWFAISVAREIGRALPTLYGIMTAWNDNPTPQWMDRLNAYSSMYTSSQSDYARQHFMAFENVANIIGDVALQWGQQQIIANVFNSMRGLNDVMETAERNAKALFNMKLPSYKGEAEELWQVCQNKFITPAAKMLEDANKATRNLTTLYMGILLNDQVYEDMLDRGVSKQGAAAIALGSILGTYGIDRLFHLSEQFLADETGGFVQRARASIKKEYEAASTRLLKQGAKEAAKKEESPYKLIRMIQNGMETTKSALSKVQEDLKYHTIKVGQKILVGGVQNMAEVLSSDVSKSVYELAGSLGVNTNVKDVGSWENTLERYVMNFLGGALGSAVFYGQEIWHAGTFKRPTVDKELVTLIRNGYANELRNQVSDMYDRGSLGSKTLGINSTKTEDGQTVYLTAPTEDVSQAGLIKKMLLGRINGLEGAIVGNQLNLSDDELFDRMVLAEKRFKAYKGIADLLDYYSDFSEAAYEVANNQLRWEEAQKTIDGTPEGEQPLESTEARRTMEAHKNTREENIAKARADLDASKEKMRKFLSGDSSREYTRQLLFLMDPFLHEKFIKLDWNKVIGDRLRSKDGKSISDDDLVALLNARQQALKNNWRQGYKDFVAFEEKTNGALEKLAAETRAYKVSKSKFEDVWGKHEKAFEEFKERLMVNAQDRMEGESEEDWKVATTRREGESENEYNDRLAARAAKMLSMNVSAMNEWAEAAAKDIEASDALKVDPLTIRRIQSNLDAQRVGEVLSLTIRNMKLDSEIKRFLNSNLDEFNPLTDKEAVKHMLDKWVKYSAGSNITSRARDVLLELLNLEVRSTTNEDIRGVRLVNQLNTELQNSLDMGEGDLYAEENVTINTLAQFINNNNNIFNFTEETLEKIRQKIKDVNAIFKELGDIKIGDILNPDNIKNISQVKAYAQDAAKESGKALEAALNDLLSHPIIRLKMRLNEIAKVKNPIGELLKEIVKNTDGPLSDEDIEGMLAEISNNYETITDINDFSIDGVKQSKLVALMDYLELLNVYIYAASHNPSIKSPTGHNKQINDFTRAHAAEMEEKWEMLPEIEENYAIIYQNMIQEYSNQIRKWIGISENNHVNNMMRALAVDKSYNTAVWQSIVDNNMALRSFKIDPDDEGYDLLDGIGKIDSSVIGTENAQVAVFELEKLLYENIHKICNEKGITVVDLVTQHKLLETIFPGYEMDLEQRMPKLNSELKADDLTMFYKILHFAAVITDKADNFYSLLGNRISNNSSIAPLTAQELAARFGQAMLIKDFRDIVRYIYDQSGLKMDILENTMFMQGWAGVGKTKGACGLVDLRIKDEHVEILGPNNQRANELAKQLNRDNPKTIKDFLKEILGDDIYNTLEGEDGNSGEIRGATTSDLKKEIPYNGEYFNTEWSEDGRLLVHLNENKITFNELENTPAAIYVDEATQLNTVEAEILAKYAKEYECALILIGDPGQLGYINTKNAMENIGEGSCFMVRSPMMTVTLRSNNLPTSLNTDSTRQVLDLLRADFDNKNLTEIDLNKKLNEYMQFMKKIRLHAYIKDDINGTYVTNTIAPELLDILKKKQDAGDRFTIAFVGDNNSETLTKMRQAGINVDNANVFNDPAAIMGSEYDYVVIDHTFKDVDNFYSAFDFMNTLYSLLTRARKGSVFINNGISKNLGEQIIDSYTVEAPRLTTVIDDIRKNKLEVLQKMEIEPDENIKIQRGSQADEDEETDEEENEGDESNTEDSNEGEEKVKKEAKKKKVKDKLKKVDETKFYANEFNDPNKGESHDDIVEIENPKSPERILNESEKPLDNVEKAVNERLVMDAYNEAGMPGNWSYLLEQLQREMGFPIAAYADVTVLSIEEKDETVTSKSRKDKKVTPRKVWVCPKPAKGPLRNLQVFSEGNKEYKTYNDKVEFQSLLYIVKALLAHKHSLTNTDYKIRKNFTQEAWDNGKFRIEFRLVSPNEKLAINSGFKNVGMTYKGHQIFANVVFEVVNNEGRTCLFDIAGLNDPATFAAYCKTEVAKIENKINNLPDGEEKNALIRLRDSYNTTLINYRQWFDGHFENLQKAIKSNPSATEIFDTYDEALESEEHLWFENRQAPVRLGGRVNPTDWKAPSPKANGETEVEEGDYYTWRDLNPDMYISDVYIYGGKGYEKISSRVTGRSVIFVSDDKEYYLNQPKDQIVKDYIRQLETGNHPRNVRMLVLGNYGLTFTQLINNEFMKEFQSLKNSTQEAGSENEDISISTNLSIQRQNYLGVRMYVSLWNARAALMNLEDAFNNWRKGQNLSLENAKDLMYADWILVNGGEPETRSYLGSKKLTWEQLEAWRTFNNVTIKDTVAQFRYAYCNNGRGHIQTFDVKDSKLYKGRERANFIALSPELVTKYRSLLDNLLGYLGIGKEKVSQSSVAYKAGLNNQLLKADKTPFRANEYIDLKDANHARTLCGLLTYTKKEGDIRRIAVKDSNGDYVLYAEGEQWSAVAGLIAQYFKTVYFLQFNPNYDISNLNNEYKYLDSNGKELKRGAVFDFSKVVGKNGILSQSTKGQGENIMIDTSLGDMLDFVFHGTIEDIHRNITKNNPLPQADDAYFKCGFFNDPRATYDASGKREAIRVDGTDVVFFKTNMREELFTVNRDKRLPGYRFFIDKQIAFEKNQRAKNTKEAQNVDKIKQKGNESEVKKLRRQARKNGNANNNDAEVKPKEVIHSAKDDIAEEAAAMANRENMNNLNNFVGANEDVSQGDKKIQMLSEIEALLQNAGSVDTERYKLQDEKFDEHLAKFVSSLNNPDELMRMIREEHMNYRQVIRYLEKLGKNANAAWANSIVEILNDCA